MPDINAIFHVSFRKPQNNCQYRKAFPPAYPSDPDTMPVTTQKADYTVTKLSF